MLKKDLHTREILNYLGFGMSIDIDRFIIENFKDYNEVNFIKLTPRYMDMLVDGKKLRYIYKTKKDILDANYFWLKYKNKPFKYSTYVRLVEYDPVMKKILKLLNTFVFDEVVFPNIDLKDNKIMLNESINL